MGRVRRTAVKWLTTGVQGTGELKVGEILEGKMNGTKMSAPPPPSPSSFFIESLGSRRVQGQVI